MGAKPQAPAAVSKPAPGAVSRPSPSAGITAASGGPISASPVSSVVIVRALHNYAPRSADELELRAGTSLVCQ